MQLQVLAVVIAQGPVGSHLLTFVPQSCALIRLRNIRRYKYKGDTSVKGRSSGNTVSHMVSSSHRVSRIASSRVHSTSACLRKKWDKKQHACHSLGSQNRRR